MSAADAAAADATLGAERCRPDDPFHDYLLLPYLPPRPAAGKLRSVNLLLESFALMGVAEQGRRLVAALLGELGPFRTVWGIKHVPAQGGLSLGWEVYFYRRDAGNGEPTLEGVLGALAPHLEVAARPAMPYRWELFSVELTAGTLASGRGGELDVYVGMRAYRAHGRELELKNFYTFDDPGLRLDRVLERLLAAVHAPRDGEEISRLLPRELLAGCPRVCVANKRQADGLYFSHLRLEQLRVFLDAHGWPVEVRQWIDRHADQLDHLLWDAGYDFRRAGRGLEFLRSGLYGFL
jgi:hypothetical protein